jgi:leucyl-tRNA synthetase
MQETSILNARWPESKPVDHSLLASAQYIRSLGAKIRSSEDQANKKKKKGADTPVTQEPKKMLLYVADKFPKWQEDVIQVLKSTYNPETKFDGTERQKFKELGLDKDKRVMPFVAMIKVRLINPESSGANRPKSV